MPVFPIYQYCPTYPYIVAIVVSNDAATDEGACP